MAIDLNYCIGCYNCQIACKDEHVGNEYPSITKPQPTFGHFWMSIQEIERVYSPSNIEVVYIPTPCRHCDDPACMKAAKDGAVYKREDGIVIIDPEKAKGQRGLVEACPYGSIYWNEEEEIPQKCTFCAHLLDDGWKEPRCVQSCPVSCMVFGDLDDPESKISKFLEGKDAEALEPEKGTQPNVKYLGLPKPCLAGTVIFGDKDECAKGVSVFLEGKDGSRRETETDFFGDFTFDNIQKAQYRIGFEARGYRGRSVDFDMAADELYLGEIILDPA
ncbi:MAG: oxidoreductase [Deltaproteobacteria bacterium]|nr:oxidoreductase [Deltaproteobacteria bacterium]MBW2137217.1 oxidoreductase [Deltaproteobacteria bacterium]